MISAGLGPCLPQANVARAHAASVTARLGRPNGQRLSGSRTTEGEKRDRCMRVLGRTATVRPKPRQAETDQKDGRREDICEEITPSQISVAPRAKGLQRASSDH